MTCSTCTHTCSEGDACPGSIAASRLALGLHRIPFLADADGGKAVAGGFAVSLARSQPAAQEERERVTSTAYIAGFFIVCCIAAACYGVRLVIPF